MGRFCVVATLWLACALIQGGDSFRPSAGKAAAVRQLAVLIFLKSPAGAPKAPQCAQPLGRGACGCAMEPDSQSCVAAGGAPPPKQELAARPDGWDNWALNRRALWFKNQYRVSNTFIRLAPMHVGFHMANRGGNPPSEQRCVQLLKDILANGFDPDDADCNGVLVPDPPEDESAIHKFNVAACEGKSKLAATVNGQRLMYGSLTHSHLNQILKNLLAGLLLEVPELADAEGRADIARLGSIDPRFATYCREGLLWDVMRADINSDPEALNTIQAAGNAKNAVGMVAHEAEAIAEVASRCGLPSRPNKHVDYEITVKQLGVNYRAIVSDTNFQMLFSFVVNMGGNSAVFIPHLQDFLSRMVNPNVWPSVLRLFCEGCLRFGKRWVLLQGKIVLLPNQLINQSIN